MFDSCGTSLTILGKKPRLGELTAKEYCILHVSYLDEEMTVFLGKKQQQGNFQAYIQRTYPKPTAIIDKFKEKLNFFYQEWATLFQVIPQKAVGKPVNAYV